MPKYDKIDVDLLFVFINNIVECRDQLQIIVDGEIEREHCVGGRKCYGAFAGVRKVMLKDARSIAKSAVAKINRAIREFEEASQ